jgi:hypothetical protein
MKDWILGYWANAWISFGLFWLPLGVCAIGYTVRTWRNFRKDRKARESEKHYYPTDTVGTLIGRGIVSVVPVANLCAAAFDLAPEMLSGFIRRMAKIFDQPLVPKRREESAGERP